MRRFIALGIVAVCCVPAFGQEIDEKPKGIFESREHYNEFMKKLRSFDNPEINRMIPTLNDIIASSHGLKKAPFGSPFRSQKSWMIRMLDNRAVRKEIEMVDYQFEDLKDSSRRINEEMTERIRMLLRKVETDSLDQHKFVDEVNAIREAAESELDNTLMPQQQKRLKQLHMQGRLFFEPLIKVVTSDPVAEELELTKAQKDDLRDDWKEIKKRLDKDINELKAKARKELGKTLDGKQRSRYMDLFGETFEFKQDSKAEAEKPERKRKRDR